MSALLRPVSAGVAPERGADNQLTRLAQPPRKARAEAGVAILAMAVRLLAAGFRPGRCTGCARGVAAAGWALSERTGRQITEPALPIAMCLRRWLSQPGWRPRPTARQRAPVDTSRRIRLIVASRAGIGELAVLLRMISTRSISSTGRRSAVGARPPPGSSWPSTLNLRQIALGNAAAPPWPGLSRSVKIPAPGSLRNSSARCCC